MSVVMQEERTQRRAELDAVVRLRSPSVADFVEELARDISEGGLFVSSPKPMPKSTLVKIEIEIDNEAVVKAVGRVVWTRSIAREGHPTGMGIKFVRIDDAARARIAQLVQDRGADEPSAFERTTGRDEDGRTSMELALELARPEMVSEPPQAAELREVIVEGRAEAPDSSTAESGPEPVTIPEPVTPAEPAAAEPAAAAPEPASAPAPEVAPAPVAAVVEQDAAAPAPELDHHATSAARSEEPDAEDDEERDEDGEEEDSEQEDGEEEDGEEEDGEEEEEEEARPEAGSRAPVREAPPADAAAKPAAVAAPARARGAAPEPAKRKKTKRERKLEQRSRKAEKKKQKDARRPSAPPIAAVAPIDEHALASSPGKKQKKRTAAKSAAAKGGAAKGGAGENESLEAGNALGAAFWPLVVLLVVVVGVAVYAFWFR